MSPRSIRPFGPALNIQGTLHACHALGLPPEALFPRSTQRDRTEEDFGLVDNHRCPFLSSAGTQPCLWAGSSLEDSWGGSSLRLHWGGSEVPGRLSSASAGVKARLLGHFGVPCGIRLKLPPLGLPESTPCLVLPCPGLLPPFPSLQAFPGALPKHTVGILTLAPGDAVPTESPLGRRRPSVQLCSVSRGDQFTKVRLSPERIRLAQVPGAGALTALSDALRVALLLVQLVRG